MSATVEAALIASLATLAGTLGTQWLSNRRETARRRAEVQAARRDELRGLLEEAALAAHDALDILAHSKAHPGQAAQPPHSRTLSSTIAKLEIIDTQLSLRVPLLYQAGSDWRLVFMAFPKLRVALKAATSNAARIGDATPTDEQRRAFERDIAELRSALFTFREVVAWSFGARPDIHIPLRKRLRYRAEAFAEESRLLRRLRRRLRPWSGDVPRNKTNGK
jgi:hypothetical protein